MRHLSHKSFESILSPSNLAMAALVGLLFVGQFTDWKMLRGRPSKADSSVVPSWSKNAAGTALSHSPHWRDRQFPAVSLKVAPQSEIVDRRSVPHEGAGRQELD